MFEIQSAGVQVNEDSILINREVTREGRYGRIGGCT